MNIIDSHVHFWNYDPINYAWIDQGMQTLQTSFTPEQLGAIYKTNHISGCIAVEAHQSINETHQLLSLSSQHSFIKGVVGYVDLLADNIEKQLLELKQYKKLKGFRMALQAYEPSLMLQPAFLNGLSKLHSYHFTYDLLLLPKHLPAANSLVNQFPEQKFVINHLAKPDIKTSAISVWEHDIAAIAKHPNVFCKLSGMVTEANWNNWTAEAFTPFIEVVLNNFGVDRIMFGSDWPVCTLASSYERWLHVTTEYFKHFSEQDQTKVFSSNAQLFYNL
ncbi:MAG: hypothetical protein RLY16_344 [Bacteroidota bacterium]